MGSDLFWTALTIASWSLVSTLFRLALKSWTPLGLCFFASVVTTFFFAILGIVQNKKIFDFQKQSLFLGILNPGLYYYILFFSYSELSGPLAQGLNYLWPIWLTLFSLNSKNRPRHFWSVLIGPLTSLLGGILLIWSNGKIDGSDFSWIGVSMGLLSGILWAFYWHLEKQDNRDLPTKFFQNFLIGSLLAGILYVLFSPKGEGFIPLNGLLPGIAVSLLEMALPFIFWSLALRKTQRLPFLSSLLYTIPFLALIPLHFWAQDPISPLSPLALLIVILGTKISAKNYYSSE